MLELISVIILLVSVIGMAVIVWRKIPVLVELPEIIERPARWNFWQKLREKIENLPFFKSFSFDIFFQKVLSKIRILTLRIENKIANYLQKLREKARKKNDDNYWQELKKPKEEEDSQE